MSTTETPKYEPFIARHFPSWAEKRESARLRRDALSTYRGSMRGRAGGPVQSGRTTLGGSRSDRLSQADARDRADDLYRNNPFARSIQNVETENIIGQGLTLQSHCGDNALDDEIEDKWEEDSANFDVTGLRTWAQFQQLAWTRPRVDGDGGIVLVDTDGQSRLQFISGDQIRTPIGQLSNKFMFDGVETDASLRPIRYHVEYIDQDGKRKYDAVDANDFIYIPHLDGPEDVRGTTSYAQCFDSLDHIYGYSDATVQAARAIAAISIIFRKDSPTTAMAGMPYALNAAGKEQRVITIENGSVKFVGSKDEIAQPNAIQPVPQFPEFLRAQLRIICLAFDMPLEIGGRDLSQVSFAGGRIGLIGFYRGCRVKQQIPKRWMSRVYRWWLSRGLKTGRFTKAPPGYKVPGQFSKWSAHSFQGQEWAYNDPEKEALADLLEISMGIQSRQQVAIERGRDPKHILKQNEQWEADAKLAKVAVVLSNSTRDKEVKVTATDADGVPLPGGGLLTLNGVQIQSAIEVLKQVGEKTISQDAAAALLGKLNIDPVSAAKISAIASDPKAISPGDREFQRQMALKYADNPGAREAMYNLTDMENLVAQTGLPIEVGAQAPWLPVVASVGPIVSGDVITDGDGDIVGGNVEPYAVAGDPPPPIDNAPPAANADPQPAPEENNTDAAAN